MKVKSIPIFFFLSLFFYSVPSLANELLELKRSIEFTESKIAGLKPGNEKIIIFNNEKSPQRTKVSLIYLHGFSASPKELSPLPEKLAKKLGANLYLHRYKGHGIQGSEGLRNVTHYDWIRETHRAFEIGRILGNEVIVLGTSTGASLAIIESLNNPRLVKALILISPNLGLKNFFSPMLLWPGGKWIARLFFGEYRQWKAESKDQEYYWTTKYPSSVLFELMRVVDYATNLSIANLQVPIFLGRNYNDSIVDVEKIHEVLLKKNAYSKIICCDELPGENDHVLAGEILSPSGTEFFLKKISDFLRTHIDF